MTPSPTPGFLAAAPDDVGVAGPGRALGSRLRAAAARYVRDLATADARGLRLMRVILGVGGVLVFWDAHNLAYLIVEHPWSVPKSPYEMSLFGISNSVGFVECLSLVFLVASALWGMGVRETITAPVALAGMISINSGMGVMGTGGNFVWCLSVVWYLLIKDRSGPLVTDVAVFGLRLQLAVVYLSSWLLKLHDGYWATGDAVAVNLRAFLWETTLGRWVGYTSPAWLLTGLSNGTLAIEFLLPVLFFVPIWRRASANLGYVILVVFHAATAILMHVGIFPASMMGMGAVVVRPWWPPRTPAGAAADPGGAHPRWKTALATLYLVLVLTEIWNEGVARHRPALWVDWPGRQRLQSTIGIIESWSMFVLGSQTHPPEPIPTNNSMILLRDEAGTVLSPVNGEQFNWGHEFITAQGRGSSLRKLTFARWKTPAGEPGLKQAERKRDEDAWFLDLAGFYASKADRPIREVYFYRIFTNFSLRRPVFPGEAWVHHEATVSLSNGEPYDIFRFSDDPWRIPLEW